MPYAQLNAEKKEKETWRVPETAGKCQFSSG